MRVQGTFVLFWLDYLLTLACGIMLAYIVAVLSPNMDVANAALPVYVVRAPLESRLWPLPHTCSHSGHMTTPL
jgi:hypothetical protein